MRASSRPLVAAGRAAVACTVLLGGAPWLSGCEAFGAAAGLFASDEVPAAYKLPAARTVVLVEDGRDLVEARRLARQAEVTAMFNLERARAVPPGMLVDHAAVVKLLDELGPKAARLPLDELGRRLGAEQVIYAQVTDAALEAAESMYKPRARVAVRVVRVSDGQRLFPGSDAGGLGVTPAGALVNIDMPYINATSTDRARVQRLLADEVGVTVARLFYDWSPPAPGEQINEARRGPAR